jgi:hypothetical protein
MTIDERELGQLLKEAADLAGPPRFSVGELTRRAGRRRARIASTAFGAVAAVAAVAVIVPNALSGHGRTGVGSEPSPLPPIRPSYTVTVNGQTQDVFGGSPADYVVKPGEKLAIIVDMTIPKGTSVKITGLWLGITDDLLAGTRNGPLDMAPVFVADPRAALGPGRYKWTLHWVAPAGLSPGAGRQLSTEVAWPNGLEERIIAEFNVQGDNSLGY